MFVYIKVHPSEGIDYAYVNPKHVLCVVRTRSDNACWIRFIDNPNALRIDETKTPLSQVVSDLEQNA